MNETQRKLRQLAHGMAQTNPDAAEYLAEEMARRAEEAKAPVCGITLRINTVKDQVEIRGGTWDSYTTVIVPSPRLGTRKIE